MICQDRLQPKCASVKKSILTNIIGGFNKKFKIANVNYKVLSILLKIQFIYQFLTLCVNIVFTLLESQVSVDCILFYRQVF